ncbi:MAG: ABC transporter ATP-binding protein [Kineosporiaceae bacterium]
MTEQAFLRVRGVTRRFGAVTAVDSVDLDVAAGETVVLLGPSGCGKTTLLRIVAGLETPEAGSVTVDGEVLTGAGRPVPPERRRIGMVFQDAALFGHLTVAGNVRYGLTRAEVRAGRDVEALEMVDLAPLAARRPHELSGGQAQRVALARALAPRPRILLFDEPFTGLDATLRRRVRQEVVDLLAHVGVTSVVVTHDQEEAFVLGDRIAVMHEGRVRQVGTPAELYTRPADPWVAGFVGEANLLPAEPDGTGARTPLGPVPLHRPGPRVARVLVRPEHVAVTPGGPGTVTGVDFHGHDCSYQVRLDGCVVRVRAMGAPTVGVGDAVGLAYAGPATIGYDAAVAEPAGHP